MSPLDPRHPHERLSALLDGELDSSERAEVEAHLGECARCRAVLEGLRTVARAAAGEETPPVPAGLVDRIGWRLRSGRMEVALRPARPWWRGPVPLSVAATVAACGILIGVWHLERREPGIPGLPVEAPAGDRLERDQGAAGRPAAPAATESAGDKGLTPAPPRRPPRRAATLKVLSPRAPSGTATKGPESKFEPVPSSRDEGTEPEATGGVVGGVLGGVVGGALSEHAADRSTATAAAPETARRSPSPQPVSPAGVEVRNVVNSGPARCASVWIASPPTGWRLRSADRTAATEELERLAARLGGSGERVGEEPMAWRIEVPRDRWPELAAALRDFGVAEADPEAHVPETAPCAEVRLTILP